MDEFTFTWTRRQRLMPLIAWAVTVVPASRAGIEAMGYVWVIGGALLFFDCIAYYLFTGFAATVITDCELKVRGSRRAPIPLTAIKSVDVRSVFGTRVVRLALVDGHCVRLPAPASLLFTRDPDFDYKVSQLQERIQLTIRAE